MESEEELAEERATEYRFFPSKNGQNESVKRPVNLNITGRKNAGVKRFNKPNVSRGNLNKTVKLAIRRKGQVNTTLLRTSLSANNKALAQALANAKSEIKLLSASIVSLQRENAELLAENSELNNKKQARKEAIRGLADSVSLSTDLIRKLVDSVTATGDWVTKVDAVDESYDENSNIARPDIRDVDVKAFEDDRSSDIYVAPDRTNSIYAVKQGGNSLSRKPQNPEASRNTSELEESVEATTSSQNRPVRSKNRPAPPPDLSVLMETSGITEEGPMQFDDVISTSPALDTVAETEESGSDGPSTKEAKIGRRTFTVSSRPRRTSSLLGKADGIGLMPSGERCSPSPQPLVEEQLRDKKRQSAAAKEKEIAKEILEVTKVDKKENGKGLRPPTHIPKKSSVINNKETAFKTVSSANKSPPSASVAKKQAKVPNSVIPVVTKNSDKDKEANKIRSSNLVIHTPLKLDRSRSRSPTSLQQEISEVQRTGESPPIRPMDPTIYQKAYVEGATPEKYCPSESSSSIHLYIDEDEELRTPTKEDTKTKTPVKAAKEIDRRGTFVINANHTTYEDSTMDIIPQDEDSEPEIIALPTVNTATVNTATVVKMPKRKSEERSDTEDEVMPKRPVKRRVNNVIFDDSDEESERPSEVDSLDKSNQNLEASCDEEETRKSSDTTVEILQRKEDNMRLMEVNIQVEKLDVDSPEVQKLLKSKGRKKMTEERTEVDGLDAHISVKSKNKIRPIEDLQERIESIENDEEETEEIAKKKPRKRKESVSKKSQPVEPAASFKVPKASKPQKLPAPVPKVEKPMRKGKSLMPIERDPFDLTLSDVTQPIEKFTRVRNVVTPPQEDEQINRSPSKGKRDSIDLDKVFDAISNDESESNEPKMKKAPLESNKRFSRKASASSTNAAAAPKVSKQRRTTKRLASEEMEELSDNESNLSVGSKAESTRSRASGSISGVDEDTVAGRSRRRAAGAVSYKEPSLNVKMRRN